MAQTQERTPMTFISVGDLKKKLGIDKIEVVKNQNTGKLFVAADDKRFKCQANFDAGLPYRFMYEDGNFDEGCLINVIESANVIATL